MSNETRARKTPGAFDWNRKISRQALEDLLVHSPSPIRFHGAVTRWLAVQRPKPKVEKVEPGTKIVGDGPAVPIAPPGKTAATTAPE